MQALANQAIINNLIIVLILLAIDVPFIMKATGWRAIRSIFASIFTNSLVYFLGILLLFHDPYTIIFLFEQEPQERV